MATAVLSGLLVGLAAVVGVTALVSVVQFINNGYQLDSLNSVVQPRTPQGNVTIGPNRPLTFDTRGWFLAAGAPVFDNSTVLTDQPFLTYADAPGLPLSRKLVGTANRVIITFVGNTTVLSAPQDLATTSSVVFGDVTIGVSRLLSEGGAWDYLVRDVGTSTSFALLDGDQTFNDLCEFARMVMVRNGEGIHLLDAGNVNGPRILPFNGGASWDLVLPPGPGTPGFVLMTNGLTVDFTSWVPLPSVVAGSASIVVGGTSVYSVDTAQPITTNSTPQFAALALGVPGAGVTLYAAVGAVNDTTFRYPASDGNPGDVLMRDGAGGTVWVDLTDQEQFFGTVNQVIVTQVGDNYTFSLPQNFDFAANVQLGTLTLGGLVLLRASLNATGPSTFFFPPAAGATGQLLSVIAGGQSAWVDATLVIGTANQVLVAQSGANFTLALPQDVATTSDVQFGSVKIGPSGASVTLRAYPGAVNDTVLYFPPTQGVFGQVFGIDALGRGAWIEVVTDQHTYNGVPNQVIVYNLGANYTFATPQDIARFSAVQFGSVKVGPDGASVTIHAATGATNDTVFYLPIAAGAVGAVLTQQAGNATAWVALPTMASVAAASASIVVTGGPAYLVDTAQPITTTANVSFASVTIGAPGASVTLYAGTGAVNATSWRFPLREGLFGEVPVMGAGGVLTWTTVSTDVELFSGTPNQVIVMVSGTNYTFSTPQDIATGSNVQFGSAKLGPTGGSVTLRAYPGAVNDTTITFPATQGVFGQVLGIAVDGRTAWVEVETDQHTYIGTANQVIVNVTGAQHLFSTPQDIATFSNVQWGSSKLGADGASVTLRPALGATNDTTIRFPLGNSAAGKVLGALDALGTTSWVAASSVVAGSASIVVTPSGTVYSVDTAQAITTGATPQFAALVLGTDSTTVTLRPALGATNVSTFYFPIGNGTTGQVLARTADGSAWQAATSVVAGSASLVVTGGPVYSVDTVQSIQSTANFSVTKLTATGGTIVAGNATVTYADGPATFTIPSVPSSSFVMTAGAQTVDGTKSFSSAPVALADVGVNLNNAFDNATVTIKAASPATTSWTLRLPDGAGSANQVLSTDGAGVASWQSVSALTGTRTLFAQGVVETIVFNSSFTSVFTTGVGARTLNSGDLAAGRRITFEADGLMTTTSIPAFSCRLTINGTTIASTPNLSTNVAAVGMRIRGTAYVLSVAGTTATVTAALSFMRNNLVFQSTTATVTTFGTTAAVSVGLECTQTGGTAQMTTLGGFIALAA